MCEEKSLDAHNSKYKTENKSISSFSKLAVFH